MHAVILGGDHELQHVEGWRACPHMRGKYCELLVSLVQEYDVQFICEEASSEWDTFGKQVARQLKLREWKSIDMPPEQREKARIDKEQSDRKPELRKGAIATHFDADGSLYLDCKDGFQYEFSPRVPSDAVKEDYFFTQAVKEAGDAGSILLVCGQLHFEEVAKRFRAAEHTVITDALYTKDWYYPCKIWIPLKD